MAAQGDCGDGASKGTGIHGVLRGDKNMAMSGFMNDRVRLRCEGN